MASGRTSGPDVLGARADDAPRRRWPAVLLTALAGVLVWVLAGPDLAFHARTPAPPAEDPADSDGFLEGVGWPARGDLAGDARFLSPALARLRTDRPEATRVYFAGTLADGSRLLLAGSDVNRGVVATSVHALYVPAGAGVGTARVTEAAALVDPQQVFAFAVRGSDARIRLVALTAPVPVRFQVSAYVRFDPRDGSPRRTWRTLAAEDGVVVADLGRRSDPVVVVRGEGSGVFTLPVLVPVLTGVPRPSLLYVEGVGESDYDGPGPTQLTAGLRSMAGLVADLGATRMTLLWDGTPWAQRRLALVLLRRPDGQRFQALVGEDGGAGFAAGVRALPRQAPSRLPWLLEPFSTADPTLLIVPTGEGSVLYRGSAGQTRLLPVGPDGVAALAEPAPSPPQAHGAEVSVLDPAGRVLVRTVLPGPGFDNPLGL